MGIIGAIRNPLASAELCHDFGVGDLVQAIKIDSTQCVLPREQEGLSLATVLDECKRGAKCKGYPRESFDKVWVVPITPWTPWPPAHRLQDTCQLHEWPRFF